VSVAVAFHPLPCAIIDIDPCMRLFLSVLAVCSLSAQPKVGLIEVYGNRKVSSDRIRKELGVRPGDPLPPSKGDAEAKLEHISGILSAQLEASCCERGDAVLYVGVEERGAVVPQYRLEPDEEIACPEPIQQAYTTFVQSLGGAAQDNETSEDFSRGYSLMESATARAEQLRMLALMETGDEAVRRVLQKSMFADQRAIAAYALQYAPDRSKVAPDLQAALQDPDESVRRNAARALAPLIVLARREPSTGLRIQPTWLVEMLNSKVLSDRLEAAKTLLLFTDQEDRNTIRNIQERALPSLYEMARWQHLPHALPAFLLLGRVAGWKDDAIQEAWSTGDRGKTIEQWQKSLKHVEKMAAPTIKADPPPMSPYPKLPARPGQSGPIGPP